jgi:RNA polymerase sigma factor (sigma-70 family)
VKDETEDIALIRQIQEGNQWACRRLIDRHKSYAYTIAFRILQNREDAEEVAQDAFIKAFAALHTFQGEARFTTWLYRIVFNAAVSSRRKKRIQTHDVEDYVWEQVGGSTDADPLLAAEQKKYLAQAMSKLSEDDVSMITLFYLKELSLEEISTITGIEAKTAKVKLFRARKRLADEMHKLLKEETQTLL